VQFGAAAFTQTQVQTFAQIVASPEVLHRVKQDLHLERMSDSALRNEITAEAPTGQSIVQVHVSDPSPERAANIANSTSFAFKAVVEGYYAVSSDSGVQSPVRLYVTRPASAPSSPASPQPLLNIVLGLLLGLLVGVALAVARDILDTRIKDIDKLSKAAGAPPMGIVVDDSTATRHPIATRASTRNVRAENFRQLRANLQFANVDNRPQVIAVTSSIPGEGKSMVAMNLAATLAEAGFVVCLVDADLRRPTIAKALGLVGSVGLTSVLINQIGLQDALQNVGPNLLVLTSGPLPPNPSEVLASSAVREVVRSLLDLVDYVILDTAPLLPIADGSEVAALADGALMVARYKLTTEPQVKRAAVTLAAVDAKLLGVLLNRVPGRSVQYGSYYQYKEPTPPRTGRRWKGRTGEPERKELDA
jgi:non-specific protein-tyrosine kinase